jgi:Na+-transporting NADH:ubiquinone oxidoreductase subunit NqrE
VKYLELFVQAAFVQNLALSFLLGMCMFLAVSRRLETAFGFGLVVFGVQAVTVPLNHLIFAALLRSGAWSWAGLPEVDLGFLRLLTFVGVIATRSGSASTTRCTRTYASTISRSAPVEAFGRCRTRRSSSAPPTAR